MQPLEYKQAKIRGLTFHFDLKTLLSLVTAACIITWAVLARSIPSTVFSVVLVSAIFASQGALKGLSPSLYGSVGGAVASVLFIVGFFVFHFVGYFYAGKPADYFEDGMAVELIIFPSVSIVFYSPLGAALGVLCGFVTGHIFRLFRDDVPAERPGVGLMIGVLVVLLVLTIITVNLL